MIAEGSRPILLDKIIQNACIFHGHLGPYLVLGLRASLIAMEALGRDPFGMKATVFTQGSPPSSCFIDGVQFVSGCTLGKGNIKANESDGPAYCIFRTKDGHKVTIWLRSEIPKLVSQLINDKGVEPAAEDLLERKIETLFKIEKKQENRK